MPVCSVCATENPDVARFCLACGASLSAESRREERKVVTVLFADLVGFTSRSEQLDPEDVRAVLAPYWERLRAELEKRGGTVEKFIGDAVMALFGAPAAHDDDPLRAVGAALAIRDWARDEADVQVRIAVNTGEALVLLGARPAEGEGMAAGDVVNTAARLQAAAPVNGVLVGETTYRATRDVIDYVEREPVIAKGKAEPVPVWEAVQVRARLGMDVERATSPLVGRTRELGVIADAFARARAELEPQLVNLVGVPGIGKSRLVGEFFSRLEEDPDLVWWRQGRALPYGEGVSFWALAEMVKAQAGIDENDDVQTAAGKLRESVAAVVDEDERSWVLDHLLPLVGVERSASGDSAPAWRRWVEGLAEQRPLVMVFEDMHWADEGLLDFIDHLVDWATGVPLLVIATARPELLDRRPAWGGGKLNVSTIALTPLSDEEAAQIIHGVLERSALPAGTQRALVERAGGNPLYAEQFARLYLERGSAEDLPLPETVQGLIAARLDGLPVEEKRLVQEASVFGKVFWAGALDGGDVEESLHALERKGIVRRERRSAVAGETQYAFRHVLIRDVAYGQIPRATRGEQHARAADWIEELGRAEDSAELVAHHLEAALELGVSVQERARHAFRRAGERALALGAFSAARRYFAAALELWPADAADRALVVAAVAETTYRTTRAREPLDDALAALEAAGLYEEAAALAVPAATAAWYASSLDSDEYLGRAERLLAGRAPGRALASLLGERARILFFRREEEESGRCLAAALELAVELELDELRAGLLVTRAVAQFMDGRLDEARALFEEAVALAPPASFPAMRALTNLGVLESSAGDLDGWRRAHAAAVEVATRAGDAPNLRWLEAQAIEEALYVGRWDEAARRARAYLADGEDVWIMTVLAVIEAARGAEEEPRVLRDAALAAVDLADYPQLRVPTRVMAAWLSILLGEDERASGLVAEAAPMMRGLRHRAPAIGAAPISAIKRTGLVAAWAEQFPRMADTRRIVAARLTMADEHPAAAEAWALVSPFDEAVARLDAAEWLLGQGRAAEADVQRERGLAFFRAVGATRIVQRAEGVLGAAAAAE